MAIKANSRYETSIVDYFTKEEYGDAYPIVFPVFDSLKSIKYIIHTYTAGETLTGLANRYFRRPELWWTIAQYNPEVTNFINIPSGTQLRIPKPNA
jgi:hypothetical protein